VVVPISHSGHDGLFGYWWTGIAGDFTARPIAETGLDQPFVFTCGVFGTTLVIVLLAVWRLRAINRIPSGPILTPSSTAAV
jgi:hypothetical protein